MKVCSFQVVTPTGFSGESVTPEKGFDVTPLKIQHQSQGLSDLNADSAIIGSLKCEVFHHKAYIQALRGTAASAKRDNSDSLKFGTIGESKGDR